jgi:hydroxymethylpyrimidine/phosphomethylpyrimidine kinase
MRTALTIAGSDSGGGAGIAADLKTFAAHGVFGTCAITAVTAQNTLTVARADALHPALVAAQIDAVAVDLPVHAVKIGMLANAGIVEAVAAALDRHRLGPIVLDPVMVAKGGARLLDEAAIETLRARLLPRAAIVTPNALEATVLTGIRIQSPADQRRAALALVAAGAAAALVKGGHVPGDAVDVLAHGDRVAELRAPRVESRHTHGTGCTLSAAIAARLALGEALEAAVAGAKAYVTRAIAQAPGLGHGHGPLQHFPTPNGPGRAPA